MVISCKSGAKGADSEATRNYKKETKALKKNLKLGVLCRYLRR
jgi:hypothetical protein